MNKNITEYKEWVCPICDYIWRGKKNESVPKNCPACNDGDIKIYKADKNATLS